MMERVIDKIRKLQRHASSAAHIGNMAEAEAFAARAQELLISYKLSQEVIDSSPDDTEVGGCVLRPSQFGQKRSKRRVVWTEDLAQVVAAAHFCHAAVLPGSNKIVMIGRKHDVEIAVYVFCRLARTSAKLAREEMRRIKRRHLYFWPGDKIFTDSFHLGFCSAIHRHYLLQRHHAEQVQAHALILRREDDAVKAFASRIFRGEASPLKRSGVEETALILGYEAGQRAEPDRAGLRGNTTERLAGGERQESLF